MTDSELEWSLEALRKNFIELVPEWVKEATGKTALPFPPGIVEGITEEDIDFLQEVFKLTESNRYSKWRTVYHEVNLNVIEATDGQKTAEKATRILQGIHKSPDSVPRAPLFLLLASAYLMDQVDKGRLLKGIKQENEEIKRIEKEAEQLHQAVAALRKTVIDTEAENKPYTLPTLIGNWIKDHHVDKALSLLDCEIEKQKKWVIKTFSQPYIDLASDQVPKSRKPSDKSDTLYQIFDGVFRLIKEKWRTRGAKKEAFRLFELWEIEINENVSFTDE